MSDIFELWSLPWHALQHSLAKGFGTETAGGSLDNPMNSNAGVANSPPANSWLARARSAAPQASQADR